MWCDDSRVVLVLDEESSARRILTEIVVGLGQRVEAATAAWQVGEWLQHAALSAVVLDAGDEADDTAGLAQIKTLRPDVPVIVCARSASLAGAVRVLRAGAFDYFRKPFEDLGLLRQSIASAVDGAWRDEAATASPRSDVAMTRQPGAALEPIPLTLDAYERLALERSLVESRGDATLAAAMLGIGRSTFYRKAAKHGLQSTRPRQSRPRSAIAGVGPRPPGVGGPGTIG
jgi:DNA-binding NtrC family response regulator